MLAIAACHGLQGLEADMKKAVLFYYSYHHENTKKVAEAIADKCGARLVHVPVHEEVDLKDYDLVGFASGIYMSEFGKPIRTFAQQMEGLEGKECFTLYTCGAPAGTFDGAFADMLEKKGAHISGRHHCRGFDTFGPFKLVGGIAKGHPTAAETDAAAAFVAGLMNG